MAKTIEMRILHITTNYPTPEYPIFGIFVKEQVESLRKEGLECDVFYCDGQGKGFKKYITYIPSLIKTILAGKYDILHCHHTLSAIILSMTFLLPFRKVVLSYQNDPDREWGRTFFRFMHLFCNRIIIKNNSQYLRYSKTEYLPNGCNEDFFRPLDKEKCRKELGWDINKKYIIYMDSNKGVRTQKRLDRFEDAIGLLREKYGYDVEIVAMRNIKRELIPIYLNAADLHMISSDFEGSPNSVKECMCCNTPVVSTNVGNVKEMIGDIEGAYVVEEFSASALADACDKVLKCAIPFDGRDKFLAKGYSMATVAEKLKSLYESIK